MPYKSSRFESLVSLQPGSAPFCARRGSAAAQCGKAAPFRSGLFNLGGYASQL